MFYEPGTGVGTIRVSAMQVKGASPRDLDDILESQRRKKAAQYVQVGARKAVHFTRHDVEEGVSQTTYSWILAGGQMVLVCSYTVADDRIGSDEARTELNTAIGIVRSLTIAG